MSWINPFDSARISDAGSPLVYSDKVTIDVPAGGMIPTKPTTSIVDYMTVADDGSGFCHLTMNLVYYAATGASPGVGIYLFRLPLGAPSIDLNHHKPNTSVSPTISNEKEVAMTIPGSLGILARNDGVFRELVAQAYDSSHFILTTSLVHNEWQKLRSDWCQITPAFASQSYSMTFRYKKA